MLRLCPTFGCRLGRRSTSLDRQQQMQCTGGGFKGGSSLLASEFFFQEVAFSRI